jgi:DNA-3-methyladenine glycosylase I
MKRCDWPKNDPLMIAYHDKEWGVPVHDDHKHFEFMVLDAFQAGLSWSIVLKKREHFRKAFDGFRFEKIAAYDESKDPGIVDQ